MDEASKAGNAKQAGAGRPTDDEVPVGDSPPRPRWRLFLAVAAWGAWFVFLVAMAVYRIKTAAR